MTVTIDASNSGTYTPAALSTEYTLVTNTNNGVFQAVIDISAMLANDFVEFRLYTMVLAAGTLRVVWESGHGGVLAPMIPISASPAIGSDQSCRLTLKQTAGTLRAYPWKLIRI